MMLRSWWGSSHTSVFGVCGCVIFLSQDARRSFTQNGQNTHVGDQLVVWNQVLMLVSLLSIRCLVTSVLVCVCSVLENIEDPHNAVRTRF